MLTLQGAVKIKITYVELPEPGTLMPGTNTSLIIIIATNINMFVVF